MSDSRLCGVRIGDMIWVSDHVSDIPDQSYAPGCVMTQEPGQNECMVSPDAWIPDHPSIGLLRDKAGLTTAIARSIARHHMLVHGGSGQVLSNDEKLAAHIVAELWSMEGSAGSNPVDRPGAVEP